MTPFSVSSLAERWGCSPSHIRNLVRKGDLKGFRVGNLLRFTVGEVEAYECGGAEGVQCARAPKGCGHAVGYGGGHGSRNPIHHRAPDLERGAKVHTRGGSEAPGRRGGGGLGRNRCGASRWRPLTRFANQARKIGAIA